MKLNRKGFTLIELLIVIVIIGILVAVLIAVINPRRARDRAKDAGIEATMSKIALSIQGHMSAYGSYPDCADLDLGIDNVSGMSAASANPCTFQVTNIDGMNFVYTYDNSVAGQEWYYLTRPAKGLSDKNFVIYSGNNDPTDNFSGRIFACPSGPAGYGDTPSESELASCDDLTD